jgi:hypothetical protein
MFDSHGLPGPHGPITAKACVALAALRNLVPSQAPPTQRNVP